MPTSVSLQGTETYGVFRIATINTVDYLVIASGATANPHVFLQL